MYIQVIFDLERGSGKAWLRYLATHFYFCRMAGAWDLIGRGTEAGKMMFLCLLCVFKNYIVVCDSGLQKLKRHSHHFSMFQLWCPKL